MKTKNFFCIRGYMKSGTNWVCRILNQHPEIDCVGEFHWETFFRSMQHNVQNIAPQRREQLHNIVRPELERMVQACLTELAREDASWIGDRTPTTIDPIVIRDAPHIVVIRDFRDIIVSRMFHLYSNPRVTSVFDNFPIMKQRLKKFQENRWYFRDNPEQLLDIETVVRDSAKEWCQFLDSDRATCQTNPNLPVMFLRYEELHSDFSNQMAQMFKFLNLSTIEIPDGLMPGHEGENPDQPNRKGQIGDWKNYMNDKTRSWIQDEADAHLHQLGYIQSSEW